MNVALEKKMREFRKTHSSKHKPAYMIYSDTVLHAIVEKMPSTLEELYKIKGVRSDFVNAHGVSILRLIAQHR